MKHLLIFLLFLLSTACTTSPLGIDPTIKWDAVTENCNGEKVSGVAYNVYYSKDAIPSITIPELLPCNSYEQVDATKISPVNSTPITGNEYHLVVPDGTYNVAVEAVGENGERGGFGLRSFTILNKPGTPINVQVTQ